MSKPETPAQIKARLTTTYRTYGPDTPSEKRHEAVVKLHESGLFNYAEIARVLGYANGGVVRNLIHPPVRDRKVQPLTPEQLAEVQDMCKRFGRTITSIATAARRAS